MLPHEKSITLKGIAYARGGGPSLLRLFVPFIQSIVNLRKLNNPRNRIAVMYFYCQGIRNIFMQTENNFRTIVLWVYGPKKLDLTKKRIRFVLDCLFLQHK